MAVRRCCVARAILSNVSCGTSEGCNIRWVNPNISSPDIGNECNSTLRYECDETFSDECEFAARAEGE